MSVITRKSKTDLFGAHSSVLDHPAAQVASRRQLETRRDDPSRCHQAERPHYVGVVKLGRDFDLSAC
jgi:hypothetical protein